MRPRLTAPQGQFVLKSRKSILHLDFALLICYDKFIMLQPQPISAKRLAEAGQKMYEQKLRRKLETQYTGKFVAIEVGSGDYFVGDTLHEALEKGRKKYPESVFYSVKVGFPAVYTFASGVTVSAARL